MCNEQKSMCSWLSKARKRNDSPIILAIKCLKTKSFGHVMSLLLYRCHFIFIDATTKEKVHTAITVPILFCSSTSNHQINMKIYYSILIRMTIGCIQMRDCDRYTRRQAFQVWFRLPENKLDYLCVKTHKNSRQLFDCKPIYSRRGNEIEKNYSPWILVIFFAQKLHKQHERNELFLSLSLMHENSINNLPSPSPSIPSHNIYLLFNLKLKQHKYNLSFYFVSFDVCLYVTITLEWVCMKFSTVRQFIFRFMLSFLAVLTIFLLLPSEFVSVLNSLQLPLRPPDSRTKRER